MAVKGILTAFLLGLLAGAAQAAPIKKKSEAVQKSTVTAPTSVLTVYTASKKRDPFIKMSGGRRTVKTEADGAAGFSIHNLSLRAVMKDQRMGFALFTDNETGLSYLFRKGKLYNERRKRVRGVMGTLNIRRKSVHLFTSGKDSKDFRLGQVDEEEEGEK